MRTESPSDGDPSPTRRVRIPSPPVVHERERRDFEVSGLPGPAHGDPEGDGSVTPPDVHGGRRTDRGGLERKRMDPTQKITSSGVPVVSSIYRRFDPKEIVTLI